MPKHDQPPSVTSVAPYGTVYHMPIGVCPCFLTALGSITGWPQERYGISIHPPALTRHCLNKFLLHPSSSFESNTAQSLLLITKYGTGTVVIDTVTSR